MTREDAYPLPRIDDTLDMLHGSKCFSTLDPSSGYWQVQMAPEDQQRTAFSTADGLFEFKVMPFGLCNAPATFQRLMDLILAGLQWSNCLVYLDDVIILGRNFHDHLQNIQSVLHRIDEAGLKLKPPKCKFFRESVEYLCQGMELQLTQKGQKWASPLNPPRSSAISGSSKLLPTVRPPVC